MENIEKILFETGIIPVVKLEDPEKAVPMCKALMSGGINAAEITFRTNAAAKAIEYVSKELPEMFVFAGTVLSIEQAKLAVTCGAKAIISPGTNSEVVRHCVSKGVPVYPGCATATEIESAIGMGLTTVKLFPAEVIGGTALLKAFYGPYRGIKFMPTGGINQKNVKDYLSLPNVIACGGSWLTPEDLIDTQNWPEIERIAKEASDTVISIRVRKQRI